MKRRYVATEAEGNRGRGACTVGIFRQVSHTTNVVKTYEVPDKFDYNSSNDHVLVASGQQKSLVYVALCGLHGMEQHVAAETWRGL